MEEIIDRKDTTVQITIMIADTIIKMTSKMMLRVDICFFIKMMWMMQGRMVATRTAEELPIAGEGKVMILFLNCW